MKQPFLMLALVVVSGCVHLPVSPPVVDHRLPHWTDSMSDGCSSVVKVGQFDVRLRALTATWTPAQRACCVTHDHRYYDGGSYEDKVRADRALEQCIVATGTGITGRIKARILGRVMFDLVQDYGGPEQGIQAVSWGWGPTSDPIFAYTDKPRAEK